MAQTIILPTMIFQQHQKDRSTRTRFLQNVLEICFNENKAKTLKYFSMLTWNVNVILYVYALIIKCMHKWIFDLVLQYMFYCLYALTKFCIAFKWNVWIYLSRFYFNTLPGPLCFQVRHLNCCLFGSYVIYTTN